MRKSFAGAAAAALLAASALVAVAGPSVQADSHVDCDWPMFGRTLGRSFAALDDCSDVSATNVATLQEKWAREDIGPVTAQPIVDDGVVYVGSNNGVFYALDAETGDDIWKFPVEDPNKTNYGVIVASAAIETIDDVKVVVFAGAATLYVLDAATGARLAAECFDPSHTALPGAWDPCTAPTTRTQPDGDDEDTERDPSTVEIESSPAVIPIPTAQTARIVVGMDFDEDRGVGPAGIVGLRLTHDNSGTWHLNPSWKYDPEYGQTYTDDPLAYRDPPPAPEGEPENTWNGCGNVWSSPMVAGETVVFGVGNCRPNNLAEAVMALNLDSGAPVFRYEPRTLDPDPDAADPDVDFGATPNLLEPGLFGEGGKDGHYYALDATGALKWKSAVAMPSDLGGIIGSTAVGSRSNGDKVVFASSAIPVSTVDPSSSLQAGVTQIVDGAGQATVRIPPGGIHAILASGEEAGKVLWDMPAPPAYGAVVYANGVVFLPDTFGFSMQAYHADTGALLWAMPLVTDAGPTAPASPVAVVKDTVFFGSGMLLADENNGGVWAFELPPLPSLGG